jgi:hypothetical protein
MKATRVIGQARVAFLAVVFLLDTGFGEFVQTTLEFGVAVDGKHLPGKLSSSAIGRERFPSMSRSYPKAPIQGAMIEASGSSPRP